MRRGIKNLFILIVIVSCILITKPVLAWDWQHGVSLGFGMSQELDCDYDHYGMFINAKLYKFREIDRTLIFTIDGSIGDWHATTEEHNHLYSIALSGAFRAYFVPPAQYKIRPYLLADFGPSYISNEQLGKQKQGAHFDFQTMLGGGVELPLDKHNGLDLSMRMIHYCNAGLAKPNEGFDIFYVFSMGFLF